MIKNYNTSGGIVTCDGCQMIATSSNGECLINDNMIIDSRCYLNSISSNGLFNSLLDSFNWRREGSRIRIATCCTIHINGGILSASNSRANKELNGIFHRTPRL